MLNRTRIKRLYVKDLLDILRDRRTLIAMIVVPIVLYPLLMLGSIQAAITQTEQIKEETIRIAVQPEVQGWLTTVLNIDATQVDRVRAQAEEEGVEIDELDPIRNFEIHEKDRADLEKLVNEGHMHCALAFDPEDFPIPSGLWDTRIRHPKVIADSAEMRSAMAGRRLERVIQRYGRFIRDELRKAQGYPEAFIYPMVIQEVDVASAEKRGGSLLGQIIPLILILMTITGAIYPAIDLTAGERERGTLETLMVSPVPVIEIITGKFLVVATVSLVGATLNLGSMGLTLYFGGLQEALSSGAETEIPVAILPLILLCLIPLSILFSAILLAVCSIARTFKEAQNYVTPVILAALVPAGIAALPGTELEGIMKAMPVANMVLLTREMLLGNADVGTIAVVVLSTCLYAVTAVALAVKVFGQEAVLFADAGSWRAQFDRRLIHPRSYPTPMLALLYVALLFPLWFYAQGSLLSHFGVGAEFLTYSQILMVLLFFILPLLIIKYYKINVSNAFHFHLPKPRFLLAAMLIGTSSWVLGSELMALQKSFGLFGVTDEWIERMKPFAEGISSMPLLLMILLLALVPAVCEEALFRGLLLSGLRQILGRWPTILAVGITFGVFHYLIQKFMLTFLLGVLLAYVCWQGRSILPAMLIHVLHNGLPLFWQLPVAKERVYPLLRVPLDEEELLIHWPAHILIPAAVFLALGLWICRSAEPAVEQETTEAMPSDQASTYSVKDPGMESLGV